MDLNLLCNYKSIRTLNGHILSLKTTQYDDEYMTYTNFKSYEKPFSSYENKNGKN